MLQNWNLGLSPGSLFYFEPLKLGLISLILKVFNVAKLEPWAVARFFILFRAFEALLQVLHKIKNHALRAWFK